MLREEADSEEEDAEDRGHPGERRGGVAGGGGLEGADAVGDGFRAGHGDAPAGEGAQQQEREGEPGREAAGGRRARATGCEVAESDQRMADEELQLHSRCR